MISPPAHRHLWWLILAQEPPQRRKLHHVHQLLPQSPHRWPWSHRPFAPLCLHWWVCKYREQYVTQTHNRTHTLTPSVQVTVGPKGDLWLHQHKGNPGASSAFLLKYKSPHLASWHHLLGLSLSITPAAVFFLFTRPKHSHNNFILFPPLQCTTFNPYCSVLFFFKCLFVLLRLSSFILSWLPRSDRTNNATGVSLNVATHRPSAGCLGDQITINFQLKQTKRWQLRVRGTRQEAVLIYDKWA